MDNDKPRSYYRTCQECGHMQSAKDPATYKDQKSETWRDVLCRKCKSAGLDYGRYIYGVDI